MKDRFPIANKVAQFKNLGDFVKMLIFVIVRSILFDYQCII